MGKGIQTIIIVALPIIVFVGGAWLMAAVSGRAYVNERLEKNAGEADRKPLNQRFGYDIGAVERHWGALDEPALRAEQKFLKLDLFFPLLYGGALACSLLMARAVLGWKSGSLLLLAPVAITALADWTENTAQLTQIKRFLTTPRADLQENWIRIASLATTFKLLFLIVSSVLLLLLVGAILFCPPKSS